MREIKFRAWDKRFKTMDFGSGDLLLRINEDDFSEPMQYTGLKDKNSKEIYEGDIVKYKTKNFEYRDTIEFRGSCFCIGNEDTGFTVDDYLVKEIEVIGNIYEVDSTIKDLLK